MDVSISALRSELANWIELARAGEEVVITDRGTPVVRLVAVESAPLLQRLTREGVLGRPQRTARPRATDAVRAHPRGPVSELVTEQRR